MFGVVRLAKHKASGEVVAIKVLNKERVWRLGAVQNLRQEKDILFQVAHPRIVNIYGTMQDEESVYIVLEFVTGGEMFTHLRQLEVFDIATTRYYVAQLVTAIAKLHEMGIAYRDVKPENIMLDSQGQLKLTDFGFAKKIEDLSFSSCGTPEYLAPEQILSQGHDKGVDWWAIGILTYEMLESQPPFFGESVTDIYKMALKYSPCFLTITDPTAKSFIKSLLHKDKTKRLGCGVLGAKEVMNHPFFAGIDWKRIELGLDKAPIQVDPQPMKNFVTDKEAEEEEEEALPVTNAGPVDQTQFVGFF